MTSKAENLQDPAHPHAPPKPLFGTQNPSPACRWVCAAGGLFSLPTPPAPLWQFLSCLKEQDPKHWAENQKDQTWDPSSTANQLCGLRVGDSISLGHCFLLYPLTGLLVSPVNFTVLCQCWLLASVFPSVQRECIQLFSNSFSPGIFDVSNSKTEKCCVEHTLEPSDLGL